MNSTKDRHKSSSGTPVISRGGLYEIRIAEGLGDHWRQWFMDFEIITCHDLADTGTLLRGCLPDQASLFGLLGRLRDLNLTLLDLRKLPDPAALDL